MLKIDAAVALQIVAEPLFSIEKERAVTGLDDGRNGQRLVVRPAVARRVLSAHAERQAVRAALLRRRGRGDAR